MCFSNITTRSIRRFLSRENINNKVHQMIPISGGTASGSHTDSNGPEKAFDGDLGPTSVFGDKCAETSDPGQGWFSFDLGAGAKPVT
jgi:hypothetical protein